MDALDILCSPINLDYLQIPRYRLIGQCFLINALRYPGYEFDWQDAPNHAMQPINIAAARVYQDFINRVGECA